MSLSIAGIVAGSLLVVAAAGGVAGLLGQREQERRRWAAGVWRDLTLRNGVTERSPFHAYESSFNAPGMVRVYPRSQRPECESVSVGASVPVDVSVRPAGLPAPSASPEVCNNPVRTGFTPFEELPELPIELSSPPHEAERVLCRELYQEGMSQTKLISTLWGISKGGGYRYSEARRRFRQHVADIATGELRQSIESELAHAE